MSHHRPRSLVLGHATNQVLAPAPDAGAVWSCADPDETPGVSQDSHEIDHSSPYRESFVSYIRGQRPTFGGTSLSLVSYPGQMLSGRPVTWTSSISSRSSSL